MVNDAVLVDHAPIEPAYGHVLSYHDKTVLVSDDWPTPSTWWIDLTFEDVRAWPDRRWRRGGLLPMPTSRPRRPRDPEGTRRLIVDTVLEGLDAGEMSITAKELARRAGVAERTVFVHFADMDEIRLAAATEKARRIDALIEPIPSSGRLEKRVDAVVAQRALIYDEQSGIRTAEMVYAHLAPAMAAIVVARSASFRQQVADLFSPELTRMSRPEQVVLQLEATLDWSFRRHLVSRQGVSQEAASNIIRRAVLGALECESA